jgi:hypothetical protein
MPGTNNLPYHTKSTVLFVIFNRPDTTRLVFEQIRIAQPGRLYIAADGPRPGSASDDKLCKQTREIASQIDWPCEVKTLFNDENIGCKYGVSAALNWFFANEDEGIILEDDCLPANSFFSFCDTLLEKYRYDTRVRHITGCNLQQGKKWGDASYYFSNRTHVWGWASWKRVWDDYDITLAKYDQENVKDMMHNIYPDDLVAECWANIFEETKTGKNNSWAYALDFANFFNNGLIIIPNNNLISNIGFSRNATHTIDENNLYANNPLQEIDEITHPLVVLPEKDADLAIQYHEFNIAEIRRKRNAPHRRIKKWFKSTIKKAV